MLTLTAPCSSTNHLRNIDSTSPSLREGLTERISAFKRFWSKSLRKRQYKSILDLAHGMIS